MSLYVSPWMMYTVLWNDVLWDTGTAFLKISFANSELNWKMKNKKNTGISWEQLTYTGYLFFSKNVMRMSPGPLFLGFWQNVKQLHSASETKFCTGKVPLSSITFFSSNYMTDFEVTKRIDNIRKQTIISLLRIWKIYIACRKIKLYSLFGKQLGISSKIKYRINKHANNSTPRYILQENVCLH